jgi:glycosyltransferase involved in cell wall biosynthesis
MPEDRRRAIVLGVHSFQNNNVKVGIQYIAEGLADSGWCVDYVSIFSSPFDIHGPQRRHRLKRVWLDRQDRYGIDIKPGLTEFAFRSIFPAHKKFLRYGWQTRTYLALTPPWLKCKRYDICINDVTSNIVYLPLIQADLNILRLNDLPEGFGYALSIHIINRFKNHIRSNSYDEIWSAHEPLTRYALELNPANHVVTIPNGVDEIFLATTAKGTRKAKTAIFIGSVEEWVDLELLDKTASLLPDWRFDVIGPLNRPWPKKICNIKWLPPIAREVVPETLARYTVGLIPFRNISGRLNYVDRPLKFFEYIGAGLGVASTDVGALRYCIGDWASYGNTPEDFAKAIQREANRAMFRSAETCREMIQEYSWGNIISTLNKRIENLLHISKDNMA